MAGHDDPETYLRLACERLLTDHDGQRQVQAEVGIACRALKASGLLEAALVESVLDDYRTALRLRTDSGRMPFLGHSAHVDRPVQLSAARVVVGEHAIASQSGSLVVSGIIFGDDATRFEATGSGRGPAARGSGALGARPAGLSYVRGLTHHVQPQDLRLSDAFGVVATASPQGWGSTGGSWTATFVSDVPLSPATSWVEIDGNRLGLPEPSPTPRVGKELLAPEDPLRAMLRGEVLGGLHRRGADNALDIALGALAATGALEPDAELAVEAKAIAAALASGRPTPGLPKSWKALLRRFGRSDGPDGELPIGAVVDDIGGCCVRFDALSSEETSFSVTVATSPGLPLLVHFPHHFDEVSPIEWWADDDRGNLYLGVVNSKGGGDSLARGALAFLAPLDPRADELRLLPTAAGERAVVSIALDGLRGRVGR